MKTTVTVSTVLTAAAFAIQAEPTSGSQALALPRRLRGGSGDVDASPGQLIPTGLEYNAAEKDAIPLSEDDADFAWIELSLSVAAMSMGLDFPDVDVRPGLGSHNAEEGSIDMLEDADFMWTQESMSMSIPGSGSNVGEDIVRLEDTDFAWADAPMSMASTSISSIITDAENIKGLEPNDEEDAILPTDDEELKYFDRIATFPVCRQIEENCNDDTTTVAEIVTVTDDGMTVIYTDPARHALGFVDITDAKNPQPLGTIELPGIPTSVVNKESFALVAIDISPSFTEPTGKLVVVDIQNPDDPDIVKEIDLGGQPRSIAVSPDNRFAVIAIENSRDKDFRNGEIPQKPAGFVVILDIEADEPDYWSATGGVGITGLEGVYEASDPEPESISINEDNIAVVTLQENNAVVLIDVASREVITSFSMGTVDLDNIDAQADGVVNQVESLSGVVREPSGVIWIQGGYFATANGGDMLGGSRGFTIFDSDGNIIYESGSSAEHLIASFGHYTDNHSDGNGVKFGYLEYAQNLHLLFVIPEQSSAILVYDVSDPSDPKLHQVLPSGVSPGGGYFVESRNLFISGTIVDAPWSGIRASLIVYEHGSSSPSYPTLMSVEDNGIGNGVPIAWGSISGLSAPPKPYGRLKKTLYAVDNSASKSSRIFTIDTVTHPAMITDATYIKDYNDVFAAFPMYGDFTAAGREATINDDKTVNIDSEGIAANSSGFWVASEGIGSVGDLARPIESLNLLFKVDLDGIIEEVISLPDDVNDMQRRFGFQGITVDGDCVVVAFQRAWGDEDHPRLGIYNVETKEWTFIFYPLDEPGSPNGGWVGLSEISSLGEGEFLVLERDNRGGPDAAIKRIYSISLGDLDNVENGNVITKSLVRDILDYTPDGIPLEKVDGMAILRRNVWIINDNDGGTFNTETQLVNLGPP